MQEELPHSEEEAEEAEEANPVAQTASDQHGLGRPLVYGQLVQVSIVSVVSQRVCRRGVVSSFGP